MTLRFALQNRGIQVDVQFPSLSHIICVQFPHRFVEFIDICLQKDVTVERAILEIVLRHVRLEPIIEYLLRCEAQSKRMVGIEIVTQISLVMQFRPTTPYG